MKKLVLFSLCVMLTANQSMAAGINCKKAANLVEQSICRDAELNKLDTRLNTKYKQLRQKLTASERADLLAEQKEWIEYRDTCDTVQCLKSAYKDRIKELADY